MNSVAGGGTIVTFPLLVALGVPSIEANATSTVALLIGIGGGIYGFRREIPPAARWIRLFAPVSVAGGLLGAWLLTRTAERTFDELVPFLLLFATVLFLASDTIRRRFAPGGPATGKWPIACALAGQFAVSTYGGYFGAGIGILMLAALGLMGLSHIHEMNAVKTVLGALINVVAGAYFVWAGLVQWPVALVMVAGSALGYYGGAAWSKRLPAERVRQVVVGIGLVLSAVFFWRQFAS
jgi:uncharacterized membrane protein YfcA